MFVSRWKVKVLFSAVLFLGLFAFIPHLLSNNLSRKDPSQISFVNSFGFKPPKAVSKDNVPPGCLIPEYGLKNNPVYEQHKGWKKPKVVCRREQDWIEYMNGSLFFSESALSKYDGRLKCLVTYMQRVDDFNQKRGQTVTMNSSISHGVKMDHDFAWVECQSEKTNALALSYKWSSLFAGICPKKDIIARSKKLHQESQPKHLNVLVFGFDSVSRLNFMGRLPRLHKFLTEDLNAFVLQKYNIVGDGTTAAMLGMLVGKYEEELPETRRGKSSTPVDVYPFVFKNFSRAGYTTLYGEDESSIGTFHYRLNGFKEEPADHYMRPFHLQAEKEHKRHPKYCLGSKPKINVLMRYLQDMFIVYPKEVPKFVFGFHSEYSHGLVEELVLADEPVTTWLSELKESGILDDTILIVMSDHGHRFSYTRETLQGKYEERLPFFAVVVPHWFEERFPNAYRALAINARDRLTSPFDIHATFVNILNTINKGEDTPKEHGTTKNLDRGLSLFSEIPVTRTCHDAGISPHWCTCNTWVQVNLSAEPLVKRVAEAVVTSINALVSESGQSDKCVELALAEIRRAQKMTPKNEFLAFKESKDHDGRVPKFSSKTVINEVVYDLQLTTTPNGGLYEATVVYLVKDDKFVVSNKEISRVNKYGLDSHCVGDTLPHLTKFCYCKERPAGDASGSYMKVIMG